MNSASAPRSCRRCRSVTPCRPLSILRQSCAGDATRAYTPCVPLCLFDLLSHLLLARFAMTQHDGEVALQACPDADAHPSPSDSAGLGVRIHVFGRVEYVLPCPTTHRLITGLLLGLHGALSLLRTSDGVGQACPPSRRAPFKKPHLPGIRAAFYGSRANNPNTSTRLRPIPVPDLRPNGRSSLRDGRCYELRARPFSPPTGRTTTP